MDLIFGYCVVQMSNFTKEEFVHILRRQSTGGFVLCRDCGKQVYLGEDATQVEDSFYINCFSFL